MKAISVDAPGDPEALQLEAREITRKRPLLEGRRIEDPALDLYRSFA